jgi:hypothetical protein
MMITAFTVLPKVHFILKTQWLYRILRSKLPYMKRPSVCTKQVTED